MADIQKSEATLVKKVWDIANVLAAAGVGFTDYITQLTYILFLKMDAEKEELGLGSSIPEGYKWKDIVELNGGDRQNDVSARQSQGERNGSDGGLHRCLGKIGKDGVEPLFFVEFRAEQAQKYAD